MMKSYLLKREFFISNHKEQIKEHFEFIKEVGRGAYGVVYQVKQRVFPNRTRVVKRISKRRVKNPTSLINELKIMALLDHPHIVKVYETFEDESSLFLVLDFCSGGQLYSRLCTQKLFSESKARDIFNQMVTAVRYMHSQNVSHRDIKLQNFMMCNEHSWDIKIIDFGLSFQWKKDMRSEVQALENGKIIGTPYYMSPQILAHNYSQKCDVWSLGVILYMLVTGTPPFDGETDKVIMDNISKYNYSLKTQECKILSPAVLDLIRNIFQPQDRRISLDGILSHPWMGKEKQMEDVLLNLQFQQLMEFSRFAKLKKLVATYIATQLSECEIESIRDIFEKIDDNQDGYITIEELHEFLKEKQGENVAMTDLQKLVLSIDTDRNGKINYNQFIAMCMDEAIMSNDDYMRFAFNSFDLNRDGKIQRQQFQLILKAYNKDFTCNQELVDALMSENDQNNDGVIDYNEFKKAMISVREKARKSSGGMDIEH